MRPTRLLILWLALFLILWVSSDAFGCPNCKEAVASQDGDAMRLANGYSWSILLMIGMPFTLLGTGTLMVVRAVKSGRLPQL